MPYPANCKVGTTLRLLSAERERRPAESQEQFASRGGPASALFPYVAFALPLDSRARVEWSKTERPALCRVISSPLPGS
jgi:hypothetical protein